MRGVTGRRKQYVEVVSTTSPEGVITPQDIVWETGARYHVERILDRRQARSLKTGGTGVRYTVQVGGVVTHLWYEGPRWFVEAKVASLPE